MKTIRYIQPSIKPSKYIENSMSELDRDIEKHQKKVARYIRMLENERDIAEQRYIQNNVCCGYVLPYNGICDVCGKHHKIVR